MSDWYDFGLACDLRLDTPSDVLDLLTYIVGMEDGGYSPPPKESIPFDFEGYRRQFQHEREATGSFFPGGFGAALRRLERTLVGGGGGQRYTFCFRCQMHDDPFAEDSWTFIKWLAPHTETGGIAYYYTIYTDVPTLVYFRGGKAEYYDVELKHVGTLE